MRRATALRRECLSTCNSPRTTPTSDACCSSTCSTTQTITLKHCNTLRHTATCCNTHCYALQHKERMATYCNILHYAAIHGYTRPNTRQNTWQHTATHSNTRQHTATCCNISQQAAACCNMLQHADIHGNTRQHMATHGNTRQHLATHGNALYSKSGHLLEERLARALADCDIARWAVQAESTCRSQQQHIREKTCQPWRHNFRRCLALVHSTARSPRPC